METTLDPLTNPDRPLDVAAVSVIPRVSWAAIFAGAFVSLGIWLLLHVLGLGIGLASIDPDDPGSLRGAGIGTGVWSLIAPIVALGVGSLLMGRLAGPMHRFRGAIHGAILWSVVTVASMLMIGSAIGSLVGSAARVGGEATHGVAADTATLGLSDAVAPVNQRLAAEGKPMVSESQLSAAVAPVLADGARDGRVDRDALVSAITANTSLSRGEAGQVAVRLSQRLDRGHAQRGSAAQSAQAQALEVAEATGKALVGFFFALLLALASAITGATLGVVREQRHPTAIAPPIAPRPSHVAP